MVDFHEDPLDPDAAWLRLLDTDGLTPRQRVVLVYVARYTHRHGFPPLVREIADHLGSRHTNGVCALLRRLAAKGRIEFVTRPGRAVTARARNIRIVGLRWAPVREDERGTTDAVGAAGIGGSGVGADDVSGSGQEHAGLDGQ